jgi:hypothetical protein
MLIQPTQKAFRLKCSVRGKDMKIISGSKATEKGQEILDTIASIILQLKCINNDLEHEFGDDVLTKKIGEGFKNGSCKYSLRDRYGVICDRLLNTSLSIAQDLGIDEKEFRLAIDEAVGDSRIYNGEYDTYSAISPSEESLELEKGIKRWWRPK